LSDQSELAKLSLRFYSESEINMKILIVEHDKPLATFIGKAFASEDHTVVIADNGEQALELASDNSFDLLILELNLPTLSGREVLRNIRVSSIDVAILILTTTDEVAERVACLDEGADDYLTKPFSFSELSARTRAVLRRRSFVPRTRQKQFGEGKGPCVFLCHSSEDKQAVRELCRRLRSDGIDPWLDEDRIMAGQDWDQEIAKAVRGAHMVVVCLSQKSVTKEGFVQKELKYALSVADEKPEDTIFIVPVRLDTCTVPSRLRKWQWVNLFDDAGYEKLIAALRSRSVPDR
jgi:CheY-like chemotaxis protein